MLRLYLQCLVSSEQSPLGFRDSGKISAFLKLTMNFVGLSSFYFYFTESVSSTQHFSHRKLGLGRVYFHAPKLTSLLV